MEFLRCMDGVPIDDARKRLKPMNSLSWIVGHLAGQEHYLWVRIAQDKNIAPGLNELVGFQKQASTPDWSEMWALWRAITWHADKFLDKVTEDLLGNHMVWQDEAMSEDIGTSLLRNIYHYWFHLGEAHAIRQMLGHLDLPVYVGDMGEVCFIEDPIL
jgi:hypothetical protein